MEWEVVPIGDSSSEETRYEASDNESSSFERLMNPHNVDEGNFLPRERVGPSTTPLNEESIFVIAILPSSLLVATGRNDDSDISVSPRNRHRRSVGVPSSPPSVTNYEWVKDYVLKYHSSIASFVGLGALWCQLELAKPGYSSKMIV